MVRKNIQFTFSLVMGLCLVGCSSNKVLDVEAPDEFMVITNKPLSVPPDYELTPPKDGAELTTKASDGAYQQLIGEQPKYTGNLSGADMDLLTRAGANSCDPDIRKKLHQECKKQPKKEKALLEGVFGSGSSEKGDPLDPIAEKARVESDPSLKIESKE